MHARLLVGLTVAAFLLDATHVDAQTPEETPFELPPGMGEEEETPSAGWGEPAEAEGPVAPARVVAQLGSGTSLRFIRNLDFSQSQFAPWFIDAFGAFVFPTTHALRHGVGLGVSANLLGDGSYQDGIDPFTQFAFTPTYLAYWGIEDFLVLTGKVGVPIIPAPDLVIGAEIDFGVAYKITAGLAPYFEMGFAGYMAGDFFHPIGSIELGLMIDYEVLP